METVKNSAWELEKGFNDERKDDGADEDRETSADFKYWHETSARLGRLKKTYK
jgi:hypothetical protein